ncbi:hypothetical protein K402DRAFT_450290 [Aulographum hederae CBS 113979]|uniref:Uncharacterized protein n=1 Tax=Aulographum hederae CBS 113979 TaxID=1176131 RepID=A0A6G1HE36_9PEZI|nr:hypothetical protein K402DRAFT_450290 [Aulographum hederae CBS 113979]
MPKHTRLTTTSSPSPLSSTPLRMPHHPHPHARFQVPDLSTFPSLLPAPIHPTTAVLPPRIIPTLGTTNPRADSMLQRLRAQNAERLAAAERSANGEADSDEDSEEDSDLTMPGRVWGGAPRWHGVPIGTAPPLPPRTRGRAGGQEGWVDAMSALAEETREERERGQRAASAQREGGESVGVRMEGEEAARVRGERGEQTTTLQSGREEWRREDRQFHRMFDYIERVSTVFGHRYIPKNGGESRKGNAAKYSPPGLALPPRFSGQAKLSLSIVRTQKHQLAIIVPRICSSPSTSQKLPLPAHLDKYQEPEKPPGLIIIHERNPPPHKPLATLPKSSHSHQPETAEHKIENQKSKNQFADPPPRANDTLGTPASTTKQKQTRKFLTFARVSSPGYETRLVANSPEASSDADGRFHSRKGGFEARRV